MESKAAVYAVVAVALGYLLISAVPNRLAILGRGPQPKAGTDEIYGLGVEEAPPAIEEEETAEGIEPQRSRGVAWEGAITLGVWVVDLLIALGVYFAVKRRLS